MAPHAEIAGTGKQDPVFHGFESLDANYIYCPNQFLDICLRHCSRGAVRIIAYVIVETLRWRDKDGNPIQQDIEVSFKTLIERANVSRGALTKYLQEAVDKGFLRCIRQAKPKALKQSAQTAAYALCWDYREQYVSDLHSFSGFYAGEGNRSPIPLEYFTLIIPQETLAVSRIVGVVLRHTVGYANQFGRRQQAPLSYSFIQQYTGMKDRTTISQGIKRCLKMNYIARNEVGIFHQDSANQRAATYAVKWLAAGQQPGDGSKTRPANRFKNPTSRSVQNSDQGPLKKPTSNGSESQPENQFNNPTTRKKQTKNTNKQQDHAAVSLLMKQGFVKREAEQIAAGKNAERVEQQIEWLEHREPSHNPLGMLRRAIQENWSEPSRVTAQKEQERETRENKLKKKAVAEHTAVAVQAIEDAAAKRAKLRAGKLARKQQLLQQWSDAADDLRLTAVTHVIQHSSDPDIEEKIKNCSLSNPPHVVLLVLDELLHPVATA